MTEPQTTAARATTIDAPSGSDGARIGTLDILRGLALFGMILIHFSLRVTEEGGGELISSIYWKVMLVFEQHFWVLFAILFGAGFAVHLRRTGARRLIAPRAVTDFRRGHARDDVVSDHVRVRSSSPGKRL